MKIARFSYGSQVFWGMAEDSCARLLGGDIFSTYHVTDQCIPMEHITLLPPCQPSKIVCVGLNYKDHQIEMNEFTDDFPKLFLKPSTAVIAHGGAIVRPEGVDRVDFEAELAVVIGRRAKNVPKGAWRDFVLGYTCFNDVTAREIQAKDGQWTRAKSYDTFAPLGPYIETEADPENLDIRLLVNGETRQSANTSRLIWGLDFLISEITKVMTLLPGDVIATGTPSGCGPLQNGDCVQVDISGVGTLTNTFKGGGNDAD